MSSELTTIYNLLGKMIWVPIVTYSSIVFLSTIWMYFWAERYLSSPPSLDQPPLSVANSVLWSKEDTSLPGSHLRHVFQSIKFTRDSTESLSDHLASPQEYLDLGATLLVTSATIAMTLLPERQRPSSLYSVLGAGLGFPVILATLTMLFQNNLTFRGNIEPVFLMLTAAGFLVTGAVLIQQVQKEVEDKNVYLPVLFMLGYVLLCRVLYLSMITSNNLVKSTIGVIFGFGILFVVFFGLVYGKTYLDKEKSSSS